MSETSGIIETGESNAPSVQSPPSLIDLSRSTSLLPDCRAKQVRGRQFIGSMSWVPVFCANCGGDGGMCPEENMTFMFYLCNKCAQTYGEIAGTMMMPDEVFFEKLKQEQLEAHGRYLTQDELVATIQDDSTSLATLLKEAK